MWIWWVLSLIILIACGVFTYRMIISSYEFLPADRHFLFRFRKEQVSTTHSETPDSLRILRHKIQHVEDNSTYYHLQFTKFQDRLNAIEEKIDTSGSRQSYRSVDTHVLEDEEDWKEMYYEENDKKERLENELDTVKYELEEVKTRLSDYETEHAELIKIKSDYELRRNDLQSLQHNVRLLQGKLDASAEREKELEQVLLTEITIREKYNLLKKDYSRLLIEVDDLRQNSANRRVPR